MCVLHIEQITNKKVLLRERKRHTDRRVTSTRYAAPAGGVGGTPGGHPPYPGRVPPLWGGGVPWAGAPLLEGCTPGRHPPAGGYPGWVPPARGVHQAGPPTWTWMGYPPHLDLDGVPPLPGPGWGTPPTWTWNGVPPPPRCELTHRLKTLPSLVLRTRSVTTKQVLCMK